MVFAWAGRDPETGEDQDAVALKTACPDEWLLYPSVLDEIQSSGGPSLLDQVAPAEWTASRLLRATWPKCDAERRKQGYPKIVETKPGEFDWGQPCKPCAVRDRQKEEKKKVAAEEDKAFWETEEKRWKTVKPSQLEVREAKFSPEFGEDYRVEGSIRNNATVDVSGIRFNVVVYDCPTQATSVTRCDVIGRASETTYVDFAAGQIATFYQVFQLPNLPKPRGVLSWKFNVEGVRAPLNAADKVPDLLELVIHSNARD
jgi:hypothetical protein